MLPFSLKVVWFVLSATGCLACWIVLWAFGRAANTWWGPVAYSFANTLLQGSFCLGMIYRMDPYQMPRAFCIAQTFLISSGAFLIAGVGMAFSLATNMAVLKPKTWGDGKMALKWRNVYAGPVVVYPIIASAIHLAFLLKFDSAKPSDDLHCDSTSPEWVRLISYAGLPVFMIFPSVYLSIFSFYRISKTNKHLQRARPEGEQFTALPRSARRFNSRPGSSVQAPHELPVITIASPKGSVYPRVAGGGSVVSVHAHPRADADADDLCGDDESQISFTFPTFADPDAAARNADTARRAPQRLSGTSGIVVTTAGGGEKDGADAVVGEWSARSTDERLRDDADEILQWAEAKVAADDDDTDARDPAVGGYVLNFADPYLNSARFPPTKTKRPIPTLSPAIWRLIIFQVAFISVQCLASVTTIIDLVRHRSPQPFGTQHVALLLSAWGPVLVFGHHASVRQNLFPWRPIILSR